MSRISRKLPNKTFLATLLLLSLEAQAVQMLSGRPDETLSASVSRVEPTMIRVDGQKIRRVFGSEGDFTVTADKETGIAYIKPTSEKQAFSIFVTDDLARTWRLLLSVSDGPSDSIVIKGKRDRKIGDKGHDLARNQAIKRVVLALASETVSDLDVRETNQVIPLWNEAMFVLVKEVEGDLKGEKYLLTNVTDKQMVIDERELYRRGVLAISVEKPELAPAETTAVYVVSERGDE